MPACKHARLHAQSVHACTRAHATAAPECIYDCGVLSELARTVAPTEQLMHTHRHEEWPQQRGACFARGRSDRRALASTALGGGTTVNERSILSTTLRARPLPLRSVSCTSIRKAPTGSCTSGLVAANNRARNGIQHCMQHTIIRDGPTGSSNGRHNMPCCDNADCSRWTARTDALAPSGTRSYGEAEHAAPSL